jgi:hypothetical protein
MPVLRTVPPLLKDWRGPILMSLEVVGTVLTVPVFRLKATALLVPLDGLVPAWTTVVLPVARLNETELWSSLGIEDLHSPLYQRSQLTVASIFILNPSRVALLVLIVLTASVGACSNSKSSATIDSQTQKKAAPVQPSELSRATTTEASSLSANDQKLSVDDYRSLRLRVSFPAVKHETQLTADAIRNRCELKIRAAGLQVSEVPDSEAGFAFENPTSIDKNTHWLDVNVVIAGTGFDVWLEFDRFASWGHGQGLVTAWTSKEIIGTHGGSSSYILDALDTSMDEFLNAYLKANAK